MSRHSSPRPHGRLLALGAVLWIALAGGGLALMNAYAGTPGPVRAAPAAWPADSALVRSDRRPTLLAFLHPQCPCSGATLECLARVLALHGERVATRVLIVRPEGLDPALLHAANWERAARLPGASVAVDEGGREAERFGAATSGHVLLYEPDGALRYSGGVTPARGHAGGSPGRSALLALLEGREPDVASAPVFGCPLRGETVAEEAGCCRD